MRMRGCAVYFDNNGERCELVHKASGRRVLIDFDVQEKLEHWMRLHGSVSWNGGVFRQTRGERHVLTTILAGLYNGVDIEEVRALHRVYCKNGNVCDCRRDNISFINRWEAPGTIELYDSIFNAVYDRGINVLLLLKDDGKIAQFDARQYIRKLLVSLIKNGAIIVKTPKMRHVMVEDLSGNKRCLAKYIIAERYHMPLTMLDNSIVAYKDGNPLNLHTDNIVCGGTPMRDNGNRRYLTDTLDDLICVMLNNGMIFCTDAVDKMEDVIAMPIWTWHVKAKDGRAVLTPNRASGDCGVKDVYLYKLRQAVEYYGAKADLHSIVAAMKRMEREQEDGIITDHVDSCPRNDCLWNLAPMTIAQNNAKRLIPTKIFKPYFWFAVYNNNQFHVSYGRDKVRRQYSCKDADDFIALLRHFYENGLNDGAPPPNTIADGERIGYSPDGHLTFDGREEIKKLLNEA